MAYRSCSFGNKKGIADRFTTFRYTLFFRRSDRSDVTVDDIPQVTVLFWTKTGNLFCEECGILIGDIAQQQIVGGDFQSLAHPNDGILLEEAEIDAILAGKAADVEPTVVRIVRQQAQAFVADLFSTLRERQLELRSGPVVFVGGGSILLREQIEASGKVAHPIFVEDICANAKGYDLLYRFSHSGR